MFHLDQLDGICMKTKCQNLPLTPNWRSVDLTRGSWFVRKINPFRIFRTIFSIGSGFDIFPNLRHPLMQQQSQ